MKMHENLSPEKKALKKKYGFLLSHLDKIYLQSAQIVSKKYL